MDIGDTIAPKSDQLNAEDLLTGPQTVTVDHVVVKDGDQPVSIHLVEYPGRPFKPSKTVRRLFVKLWGADSSKYAGRRMTIFRDPDVKWAGQAIGGIRVSHVSHIDKRLTVALTETQGKRTLHTVDPLVESDPRAEAKDWDAVLAEASQATDLVALKALWDGEGVASAPNEIQAAFTELITAMREASS